MKTDAAFYKAIEMRQHAAFSALGLVATMVRWGSMPATHMEQALRIVAEADAADKALVAE